MSCQIKETAITTLFKIRPRRSTENNHSIITHRSKSRNHDESKNVHNRDAGPVVVTVASNVRHGEEGNKREKIDGRLEG